MLWAILHAQLPLTETLQLSNHPHLAKIWAYGRFVFFLIQPVGMVRCGVIYLFLIDHSHAVAASCMMDAERNGAYSRSACPLQFFDHIWDFASPYYYILNRWVGHLLTFLYDAFLLLRMNFFREYTPLVPRSGAGSRTWQHWSLTICFIIVPRTVHTVVWLIECHSRVTTVKYQLGPMSRPVCNSPLVNSSPGWLSRRDSIWTASVLDHVYRIARRQKVFKSVQNIL